MKRLAGMVLVATATLISMGCLIWPFPTGDLLSGRGRIQPEYAAPLQIGKATRDEVLLRLGEPDEVLNGGVVYIYRWTEARGLIAFGGYGGAVAIPFPGHRHLRLEFDTESRLTQARFGKGMTPDPSTDRSQPELSAEN